MLDNLRVSGAVGRLAQLVEHLVYTDKPNAKWPIYGPLDCERSVTLW